MVEFKQEKPITVKILGGFLVGLAVLLMVFGEGMPLSQLVGMTVLGLLLLGYSVNYEIYADYNNKRSFRLFGIPLYKSVLNVAYPDYISLFSARVGKGSDWGPVAAMGGSTSGKRYTVRLFMGNRHFTLFRTVNLGVARSKSKDLGSLLNVPVKEKIS